MTGVSEGCLWIVGTPIGNLEDITRRALSLLNDATLILAEDTRRTRALISHFDIRGKTVESLNQPVQEIARILMPHNGEDYRRCERKDSLQDF